MSSDRGQYDDEMYNEEGDQYAEPSAEARESGRRSPTFPISPWGWWPTQASRQDTDRERSERKEPVDGGGASIHDGTTSTGDGIGRYWDEGLITLLVVGGAILFLIPEPATSALGILLMGLGVIAWLADWAA